MTAELGQTVLVALGALLMVVALILSFIPILPGPVLAWAVALVFGVLDGFRNLEPLAAVIISGIMVFAVSSDFWLPALGVKTGGLTCLGAVGSLIGGLLGTFVIPVPILGTLIGCVVGALAAELVRFRNLSKALRAGQSAATMFVLGYVVEVASSIAIFIVFVISIFAVR